MSRNKSDKSSLFKDTLNTGAGFVIGGELIEILFKPAEPLPDEKKKFDFTPYAEIAGGALMSRSSKRSLQLAGAGLVLRGAIRAIGKLLPGVSTIAGFGCAECGGKCGGKGLGCPSKCTCKNKTLSGVGTLYDPSAGNTGSVNGGVVKKNVTFNDLMTLPGARAEIINLIPNVATLSGRNFNFFYNNEPPQLMWDVIYNFFPNFFRSEVFGPRFNAGLYKKFYLSPNPPRKYEGALSDFPLDCVRIGCDYADGSQATFDYAPEGSIWRLQQTTPCGWGIDNCTTTQFPPSNGRIFQHKKDVYSKGEAIDCEISLFDKNKYEYVLEFSDGSRFSPSESAFRYLPKMTGQLLYKLWVFAREAKGGRVCVETDNGSFTVSNVPAKAPGNDSFVASLKLDGDKTGKVGMPVTLTGTYGNNVPPQNLQKVTRFEWDFGDGTQTAIDGNTQSPQVVISYDQPGSYTVTLCAIFADGTAPMCVQHPITIAPAVSQPPTDRLPNGVIPLFVDGPEVGSTGTEYTFCLQNPNKGYSIAENEPVFTWNDGVISNGYVPGDPAKDTIGFVEGPFCQKRTFDRPGIYTVEVCGSSELNIYPNGVYCINKTIVITDPQPPVFPPFDVSGEVDCNEYTNMHVFRFRFSDNGVVYGERGTDYRTVIDVKAQIRPLRSVYASGNDFRLSPKIYSNFGAFCNAWADTISEYWAKYGGKCIHLGGGVFELTTSLAVWENLFGTEETDILCRDGLGFNTDYTGNITNPMIEITEIVQKCCRPEPPNGNILTDPPPVFEPPRRDYRQIPGGECLSGE